MLIVFHIGIQNDLHIFAFKICNFPRITEFALKLRNKFSVSQPVRIEYFFSVCD